MAGGSEPNEVLSFTQVAFHVIYLRVAHTGMSTNGVSAGGVTRGHKKLGMLRTIHHAACIPGIGRSAALQMLAIATAIAALRALHPIPIRGAGLPFELFRASLMLQKVCYKQDRIRVDEDWHALQGHAAVRLLSQCDHELPWAYFL